MKSKEVYIEFHVFSGSGFMNFRNLINQQKLILEQVTKKIDWHKIINGYESNKERWTRALTSQIVNSKYLLYKTLVVLWFSSRSFVNEVMIFFQPFSNFMHCTVKSVVIFLNDQLIIEKPLWKIHFFDCNNSANSLRNKNFLS